MFWQVSEVRDVWSLGISLIEFATGVVPHSELHWMRALFTIPRSEPPTLASSLKLDSNATLPFSDQLHAFLARCLVKDPEKRASVAELLRDPWIEQAQSGD